MFYRSYFPLRWKKVSFLVKFNRNWLQVVFLSMLQHSRIMLSVFCSVLLAHLTQMGHVRYCHHLVYEIVHRLLHFTPILWNHLGPLVPNLVGMFNGYASPHFMFFPYWKSITEKEAQRWQIEGVLFMKNFYFSSNFSSF